MQNNTMNLIKELAPVAIDIMKDLMFKRPDTNIAVDKEKSSIDIIDGEKKIDIHLNVYVNVYTSHSIPVSIEGKNYEGCY